MANKFKDDELLICIESFVGEFKPGDEFTGARGKTRIRGSHRAARRWPEFFAPADATDDEIGERRAPLVAHEIDAAMATDRQMRVQQARREPAAVPLERAVVAINTFTWRQRQVVEGLTVLDRDDEIVRLFPQHFATQRVPLVR